jgi:hypothetical protein
LLANALIDALLGQHGATANHSEDGYKPVHATTINAARHNTRYKADNP